MLMTWLAQLERYLAGASYPPPVSRDRLVSVRAGVYKPGVVF